MSIQNIDFGTSASNDGETLFAAFTKIQANTTDLYNGTATFAGGTLASSATVDLGAALTPVVQITGTTTITSFGTAANTRKWIYFSGACPITYNATSMITPFGVSFTTAAGDCAVVASDANGYWRWLAYLPAASTGTGAAVLATSPTLVTPTIGIASATSINKVAITAPASSATLTIANGKTLTSNSTMTLQGGDAAVLSIDAGKTLTASSTMTLQGGDASVLSIAASKTFTVQNTLTLNAVDGKALSINKSLTLDGTDSTTLTFPSTSATIARTDAGQTFSGTQTFAGSVALAAGTTSLAPLAFSSGVNLTTATAGVTEYDGSVQYFTAVASARQVVTTEQFISLTATYTLTSTTAAQKIFNTPTNGTLTVAASTSYFFECMLSLSSMSATSGNFAFQVLGAGTATMTSVAWMAMGADATTLSTATAFSGSFNATSSGAGDVVTAATNTGAMVLVKGIFRVNAGGTIIPSVALTTAAAAVVGVNSYFRCYPIGTNTVQSVGNWS